MNKKILVMTFTVLTLVMLTTPLIGAVEAKRSRRCCDTQDFDLLVSGEPDTATGTVKEIFKDDVLKKRYVTDRGWIPGSTVELIVGEETFSMTTDPFSVDYITSFDAKLIFNDDGTNKITFLKLVDVITLYDDGVAIGTFVLKVKATMDFTGGIPPTYSGTVRGYGTGALKGVRISAYVG